MKKKNILTAAVSLSLVACLSIGATLAYFTDKTEIKTNTFTAGRVDITLVDTTPEHEGWKQGVENEDGSGLTFDPVMPGDTLSKHVAVTVEEDSQPAYVAVRVAIDAFLPYGDAMNQSTALTYLYGKIGLNSERKWDMVMDEDGQYAMFYYKEAVNPGETVTLMDTVEIPPLWDNDYAGMNFNIAVQAAAVQAENTTLDTLKGMTWEQLATLE